MLSILTLLTESPAFCEALAHSPLLRLLARVATTPDLHTPAAAELNAFAFKHDAMAHEQTVLVWTALAAACEHSVKARREALEIGFLKMLLLCLRLPPAEVRVRLS